MSNKITVSATVNADVNKVWDFYNEPEHITKWNFAIPSWTCPSASNDLKVGGKYKARMEAKDGSMGFDLEGTYNEVTPLKSFTYTMPNGREVSGKFTAHGEKTDVAITFELEDENSLEQQRQGWQGILDNFKKHTEAN